MACSTLPHLDSPVFKGGRRGGESIYKTISPAGWQTRDSIIVAEFLSGNRPQFLNKLVPVRVQVKDEKGASAELIFFTTRDYLAIGTNTDWARVPMTPMAAQKIADSLNCILPTPKMVDLIWSAARVKLEPVPLLAYRDSGWIFWQHHLIIEGQRKGRDGLIAGIKKDIVNSGRRMQEPRANRVAIYGWHRVSGKPIQPVYCGHVNWYVDYSHGVRLVYNKFRWKGRWITKEELNTWTFLANTLKDSLDDINLKYKY